VNEANDRGREEDRKVGDVVSNAGVRLASKEGNDVCTGRDK